MKYRSDHFLELALMGDFDKAADWLDYEPTEKQAKVLDMYNINTPEEHERLSELFRTINELDKYGIDLMDFEDNIIDNGNHYVIVDLGF